MSAETYEQYVERLRELRVNPLSRAQWAKSEERTAWQRRMSDLDTPLTDEEVEKLLVELRDKNASHKRYPVQTYGWATNCPHDTDALEAEQPYFIGDGPEHPDEDEHHKRDEEGELFCLLSPLGEVCVCGDGYCARLSELSSEAEDFWLSFRITATQYRGIQPAPPKNRGRAPMPNKKTRRPRRPQGIQQQRTKGWRKPEGAISVARPTRYGNPYRIGDDIEINGATGSARGLRIDAQLAVALFRKYALEVWGVEKIREDLAGHDLMCFCKLGDPCHRDVLLELANPGRKPAIIGGMVGNVYPGTAMLGGGYFGPPPPGATDVVAMLAVDRRELQMMQAHR